MTVSPDARTPSADLHILTGSTPPGAAPTVQPFGVATAVASVAEMPDTWQVLGPITTGILGGLTPSRQPNPDLAALVDEFEAKEREANALTVANKGIDCDEIPGWIELCTRLDEIMAAMYDMRAQNMADVLLVSRLLQCRWVQGDRGSAADLGHNLADDLLRLHREALPTASHPQPDPFPDMFRRANELRAAGNDARDVETADRIFDQCDALDEEAIAMRASTPGGAIACLEWLRADHFDFAARGMPQHSDRLMMALLDSAIGVLCGIGVASAQGSAEVADLTAEWLRTSPPFFAATDRASGTSSDDPTAATAEAEHHRTAAADLVTRRRIAELRSTTREGLILKAAAILACAGGLGWLNREVDKLVIAEEVFEDELSLSLARDVIDLLGAPVRALAKRAGLPDELEASGYAPPRDLASAA